MKSSHQSKHIWRAWDATVAAVKLVLSFASAATRRQSPLSDGLVPTGISPASTSGDLTAKQNLAQRIAKLLSLVLLAMVSVLSPTSAVYSAPAQLGSVVISPGPTLFVPLLAQAQVDPKAAAKSFLDFLAVIFLLCGACVVAYGGILVGQGRTLEGILAILGGFILALAIPITYFFAKLAGISF